MSNISSTLTEIIYSTINLKYRFWISNNNKPMYTLDIGSHWKSCCPELYGVCIGIEKACLQSDLL